jgi:hypothetical protein
MQVIYSDCHGEEASHYDCRTLSVLRQHLKEVMKNSRLEYARDCTWVS